MHDRCSFIPNPIEGPIPLLRELDIDVPTEERYIGPDPVHAPLLRKLVVHLHQGGRFFPLFSPTSWTNLIALKLGYLASDDAARILRCTPNLVHSWLIFWGDPADEDTSQLSPGQLIRLPHLRTLILDLAEPRSLTDFIRILVLPSLQRVALKEAFLWQLLPHPITLEQMDIIASVFLDTLRRWECTVDALTHIRIMGHLREIEVAYRAAFTNETVLDFGDPPGFTFESTPYWPVS
uniref:Uncharacterized protein n=1 Tax=Mycena chlorophos TaxID=658473 RepID=A0ABQ0MD63_MYCCL|nr:predicted protein [Mycena chlorophos]